jgi:hypothetical protein
MPYQDDNLSKLFQKAANDYPLKTDNSDWDSVAAKLNDPATKTIAGINSRIVKYTAIIVLLFGGITLSLYKLQFKVSDIKTKQKIISDISINKNEGSISKSFELPKSISAPRSAKSESGFGLKNSNSVIKESALKTGTNHKTLENTVNVGTKMSLNNSINTQSISQENSEQKYQPIEAPADNKTGDVPGGQISYNNQEKERSLRAGKTVVKYKRPPSKFYGTIYGSPVFSMVKFQQLVKPGYKIGVGLGYKFSDRFSVELGVQRERINYYTNGKYFDKSGFKIKDPKSLESVNGSNKLTSVPITVKYDFLSRGMDHFYATCGINAITITHTEDYDYVVSKNGILNEHSKSYSSVTGPKYLTSINLGAGYEAKLNNWFNLRVEPYYQLPTCNLGVGKIPVTSFGVNVGIVKNLK